MEIREITNKNEWEDFLMQCAEKTFLQSWNWASFAKASEGQGKIWRLGIYENNSLIAVCLTLKVTAKRGTFLFIPHGPVIASELENKRDILKTIDTHTQTPLIS